LESGVSSIPFSKQVEIDCSILAATADKNPFLSWNQDVFLGRFAGRLWLFDGAAEELPKYLKVGDQLEFCGGILSLAPSKAGFAVPPSGLTITQRSGGERFRKVVGGQSTQLKKYLNEKRVLPWWRDQLPLLWNDTELVAVANLWQRQDTEGWQLAWSPAPLLAAS
jgi:tRNA(Ile)-lysidine synthetase-like protein